jgi:hypothetical protein
MVGIATLVPIASKAVAALRQGQPNAGMAAFAGLRKNARLVVDVFQNRTLTVAMAATAILEATVSRVVDALRQDQPNAMTVRSVHLAAIASRVADVPLQDPPNAKVARFADQTASAPAGAVVLQKRGWTVVTG